MAKAEIKLPDGTSVAVDGSAEEIAKVLSLYGGAALKQPSPKTSTSTAKKSVVNKASGTANKERGDDEGLDVSAIVNLIKNSDDAERIEKSILDRTSQVNRTLLPLYVLQQEGREAQTLSSGDIAHVMKQLGVPMSQPNVSRALSGTASKYVMADSVRSRGRPTGYKLSRRGVQYMAQVIAGKSSSEE